MQLPTDLSSRRFGALIPYAQFKAQLVASNCSKCPDLCRSRTNIVVDRGNPKSKLVFIGEAPGEKEDLSGKSFVGRSGQLLDKIMAGIGIDTNNDALILNVVKCRPPKNRPPEKTEAENCLPYLKWQLERVNPEVIVLLGATAAKYFLPKIPKSGLKSIVGQFFDLPSYPKSKFMQLFHPAYLLRDPRKIKDMEKHAKELKRYLESIDLSKIEA